MNTDTAAPGPETSAAYGACVLAVLCLLLGVVEVGFAALVALDAAHQSGDGAMFAGLGYLLAAVVGVPGAVAIVAAGASLLVRRRAVAAYASASASALAVLAPLLVLLGLRG